MIRGMESAAKAMSTQMAREEVIARNLANLSTAGYKQESTAVSGFVAALDRAQRGDQDTRLAVSSRSASIGGLGLTEGIDRVSVDFSQGRMEETGRGLDVALQGDGFLRVRTPDGDFYTRGGALHVDATGLLTTADGYMVLDPVGEIVLPEGPVSVGPDGMISVGGQQVTNLDVVEFEPGTVMTKVGELLYAPDDPSVSPMTAAATTVRGGYLEASNVDDVSTMTEMAQMVRVYQANQRMLAAQDELLGKAVNELGRV